MTGDTQRVRVLCKGEVAVPLDAASALALFTPEGERAWVDGWAPRYPQGAVPTPTEGLAFQTDKGGDVATWLVVRYDPEAGRATYAYVLPGRWATMVDVTVAPVDPSRSRARVTYHMTSLSPEDDAAVRSFADGFPAVLARWEEALEGARPGASVGAG